MRVFIGSNPFSTLLDVNWSQGEFWVSNHVIHTLHNSFDILINLIVINLLSSNGLTRIVFEQLESMLPHLIPHALGPDAVDLFATWNILLNVKSCESWWWVEVVQFYIRVSENIVLEFGSQVLAADSGSVGNEENFFAEWFKVLDVAECLTDLLSTIP